MRFLTNEIDRPELTAAYEEAMIRCRMLGLTEDFLWLWKHPKTMYLTNKASILCVNRGYSQEINYPVTRSGVFGGTIKSVIVAGGDWSILCCINRNNLNLNTADEYNDLFFFDLWKNICNKVLLSTEKIGNDLVVQGTDRKIVGQVFNFDDNFYSGHNTFSVTLPEMDMSRMFIMPDELKETTNIGKKQITSLEKETGVVPATGEMIEWVKAYFLDKGVRLTDASFDPKELAFVERITDKHISEEWVKYGNEHATSGQ